MGYSYPAVGQPRPHAPTSVGGQSYTWDAAGNLTTGGGRSLVWDAAQRPTSITSPSGTESYAYDADGGRVRRTVGGVTTVYLGDDYEEDVPGNAWRIHYAVGGQVVAQRTSAGVVTYLHGDHLGSVSAATSSSGAVLNTQSYKPWGEVRTGDLPQTTRDFTGQRRDGTGLLHYNARYYDAKLGLFISADTIVPGTASGAGGAAATVGADDRVALAPLTVGFVEPGFLAGLNAEHRALLARGFFDREQKPSTGPANPQALNRYAYVLNNPVRYTDPTGHCVGPVGQQVRQWAGQMGGEPLRKAIEFALGVGLAIGAAVACIANDGCGQGIIDLVNQGQATLDSLIGLLHDDIRVTDSGDRVRVRALKDPEVKALGLEEEKGKRGYGPTDNIYVDRRTGKLYVG